MPRRTRRTCVAEANSRSLTDRFPAEVLTEVFASLQDQLLKEFTGRKRLQWIGVTHVSRRWRSIALGCARLWGDIQSGDPAIREWLKRARGTALFVELKIGTMRDESTFNMVLRKLSQIQTLTIELSPTMRPQTYSSLWPKVLSLLSSSAPMLESFCLEDPIYRQRPPVELFGGITPRLRLWDVDGFVPNFSSPVLNNLTTLSICNPYSQLDPGLTLSALARMPLLETLALEGAFLSTLVTGVSCVPANAPAPRLVNLTNFTFTGINFDFDIDFLAHLSLNVDTLIMFVSHIHRPDLSAFSRFVQAHNRARGGPAPIRVLQLYGRDRGFKLLTSNDSLQSEQSFSGFRVEGPWAEDQFPISWGEELLQLPLANLEYFGTDCALGRKAWEALSTECMHIYLLSLDGTTVAFEFFTCLLHDYIRQRPVLTKKYAEKSSQKDRKFTEVESAVTLPESYRWDNAAFSRLRAINLRHIDFEECGDATAGRLVDCLATAFRARADWSNSFVEEVLIRDCLNLEPAMVDTLRESVTVHLDDVEFPRRGGNLDNGSQVGGQVGQDVDNNGAV
ncbi:hypothetical protein BDN72DRAFT_675056 [Pluteus cervinus]|uniref:Uncharacterized protein n=1 Tax=Pluteus cervinus TaxID=181527 RepID=A0ACD3ASF0_9AGAR|nr:hypothetical protein BDN72DRAFT_675056 [Pluteus cervinus]